MPIPLPPLKLSAEEQAKKVGLDVEDDEVINRIVHEEKARWRERNRT